MNRKSGIERARSLRHRRKDRRGRERVRGGPEAPPGGDLSALREQYLSWLEVRNYSAQTVEGRRRALNAFLAWAWERDLRRAGEITRPILESHQRHLHRYRKKNGKPLGASSQRGRIAAIKDFFRWMVRANHLLHNPASELELPRPERRLPEEPLSLSEVKAILAVPDTADPLGLRDRALLETLYSTAIRRGEAVKLAVTDLNHERRTLQVRQGKGKKDRVVPVGERALYWLSRYLDESRPRLALHPRETALFLTAYGEAFNADFLSHHVSKLIKQSGLGRPGSCHLFRHTCATHMHDNGADIRFIQQMLGHEKLETTQIYTEVSIKALQEIHDRTHPAARTDRPKE